VAALRVADLEIDALRRRIRQGSRDVRLSPVEHILLYTLAAAAGAVVSYRELAEALGTDSEFRNNTLARHVSSLRRKLRDDADRPRYVETVIGVGYRFAATTKT
jgi:two-component system response regulator RegX3